MKPNDYLKYWRVVRYWIQNTYGLSTSDLEVLLFLYTEGNFTYSNFKSFDKVLSWNRERLYDLAKRGWVDAKPIYSPKDNAKVRYCISTHGKHVVNLVYRKLGLEEELPHYRNPMYEKRASSFYKKYRDLAEKMNKDVVKERLSHRSQQ
jgi:hypothetical protein